MTACILYWHNIEKCILYGIYCRILLYCRIISNTVPNMRMTQTATYLASDIRFRAKHSYAARNFNVLRTCALPLVGGKEIVFSQMSSEVCLWEKQLHTTISC